MVQRGGPFGLAVGPIPEEKGPPPPKSAPNIMPPCNNTFFFSRLQAYKTGPMFLSTTIAAQ